MYNEKKALREPKIKYVQTPEGKTIAITKYAGKTIRGIAKWNPVDKFDAELGKEYAKRRLLTKYYSAKLARLSEIDEWYATEIEILNERRNKIIKAMSDTAEVFEKECPEEFKKKYR